VHLRPPSLDHGLVAGLWAIGLGLYIFLGGVAIGAGSAESVIIAAVSAAIILVYIRLYGREDLRARRRSPRRGA
jgi:hypothetical protein